MVNLLIVTGIFLASDYVALTWWGKTVERMIGEYLEKAIIWGGALFISFPFLIAVYRRIKVVLILAELRSKKLNNQLTIKIRKIILEVIPIISLLAFLMFVSIFSINILPPIKLVILMLLISLGIVSLLFRWLIKLHIKLQIYLLKSMRKKEK
jgi:CPA2 family monovalent cation:H+ antiporter-2